MSLSPALRFGVTYFGAFAVPLLAHSVAVPSQNSLLSSKSMLVVPLGFCTRDQNSSRNASSVKTPNALRSLLFGGIDPSTIVGFGLSSAVPWPKLSSFAPVGLSFLASTPERNALSVPLVSQSMQPSVLTIRFALVSISNALPSGARPSVAALSQVAVFAIADPGSANATASAAARTANAISGRRGIASFFTVESVMSVLSKS